MRTQARRSPVRSAPSPVVRSLVSQEEITVLAQVVREAGDGGFVFGPERLGVERRALPHRLEMLRYRVLMAPLRATVGPEWRPKRPPARASCPPSYGQRESRARITCDPAGLLPLSRCPRRLDAAVACALRADSAATFTDHHPERLCLSGPSGRAGSCWTAGRYDGTVLSTRTSGTRKRTRLLPSAPTLSV